MKPKKWKFGNWIVVCVLLCVLGIGSYICYIVVTFQKEILENQLERFPQTLESPHGVYTLRASVEENSEIDIYYVNIAIVENATNEEVFTVENIYRMYDFHWLVWENVSDNFWIKSGDLGTFCYKYQENGRWEKYVLHTENGNYWLSQDGGGSENVNLEELVQRLPEEITLF